MSDTKNLSEVEQLRSDLAAIIAERDALHQEVIDLRKDKARLDLIENSCWDLRCVDEPTPGGDDGEVAWVIIEHHMSAPKERQLAYEYSARRAIDAALNPAPELDQIDELEDDEELAIDQNWNGSLDVQPNALR